jgi:S-adenosylmethionine hydrolase
VVYSAPVQIITLTTDFGAKDWFVGTMKGVILGINPRAGIVDVTHEISPGDIRAGAFALAASYSYFPKDTVHVAVVDPGVGGGRKAIAVQTASYFFVGPDNGVLSFALAREKIKSIHRLENERFFLQPISQTFHGRDLFAPVAAHLSRGLPLQRLGPVHEDFVRLRWPKPRILPSGLEGEVVYVDRFGNVITNINNGTLPSREGGHVFAGRKRLCPVKAFYQSVPRGQAVAVSGSSGFLEIAINGGSAAEKFDLRVGCAVSVRAGGGIGR